MNTKLTKKVVLKDRDVSKKAQNVKGGKAPNVSEIVVTKVTDCASPTFFRSLHSAEGGH